MLEFNSVRLVVVMLAGVELMHMIQKGHALPTGEMCLAGQVYPLTG